MNPLERQALGFAAPEPETRPSRSPEELIELAFKLWDDDCALFAAHQGISLEEAAQRMRSSREAGRIPFLDSE